MSHESFHRVAILADGLTGALIAAGGDRMNAPLDRGGTRRFALLAEIAPGFPVGFATIAAQPVLPGRRAGGFGDDATLRRGVDPLSMPAQEATA